MWNILYDDSVLKKDIPSLDGSIKKQIQRSIETKLIVNPLLFGKPLQYQLKNERAFRVGDYRVLYRLEEKNIIVFCIGHRSKIYQEGVKRLSRES